MKKYIIELSAEERDQLQGLLRSGKTAIRKATRAQILLKADDGLSDEQIAEEVSTSVPTIERVRKRFVEESLNVSTNIHAQDKDSNSTTKPKRI